MLWPLTLGAGGEGMQARLYLYGLLPLNNANPPKKDFSSLEILLERQVNFNGETLGCDGGGRGEVCASLRPFAQHGVVGAAEQGWKRSAGGKGALSILSAGKMGSNPHPHPSLGEQLMLWVSCQQYPAQASQGDVPRASGWGRRSAPSHHPTPGMLLSSEHPVEHTATSSGVSVARGGLIHIGGSGGSSGGCVEQVHPPWGSEGLTTWESTQV